MNKQRRSDAAIFGDDTPTRRDPDRNPNGGRSANPYRDELYREQARVARLKGDQLAGTLVPVEDVRKQWSARIVDTRQRLLAVPSRVGAKLGLTREQIAEIDREIRAALEALATGGVADAGSTPQA